MNSVLKFLELIFRRLESLSFINLKMLSIHCLAYYYFLLIYS